MKRILICSALALAAFGQVACQKSESMSEGKGKQVFPTAEAAAAKAKQDLLAVIRSGQGINLGLDAAAVEKSQPGRPLQSYQITFERLLAPETNAFAALRDKQAGLFVPLLADGNVVTAVQLSRREGGFGVASLGEKAVADDLNALRRAAPAAAEGDVAIYSLPHSGEHVYEVGGMLHTNYPGFSIAQAVAPEALLATLRREVAEFQRLHGEALRTQRLVK